jgi:hypothetical protein
MDIRGPYSTAHLQWNIKRPEEILFFRQTRSSTSPYTKYFISYGPCINVFMAYVSRMGEGRGAYRVLVGMPEGKRPLGRSRRRWEDNIKMDFRDIGIDGTNWIRLVQDTVQWRAFVNTVMNLRVP